MRIRVDKKVLKMFPSFHRGVIIASGVDNNGEDANLRRELEDAVMQVRHSPALHNYKNHSRIASWRETFTKLGTNPNQNPPSVANLIKRTRNGSNVPFINKLVALFNITSLRHLVPSGGDDLRATSGLLCLGIANGDETYTPLGNPDVRESPTPGEVIYYDVSNKEVLCRRWCSRNSHKTRISSSTTRVAINVDGLRPVTPRQVEEITLELAAKVKTYCGGECEVHWLSNETPEVEFDI